MLNPEFAPDNLIMFSFLYLTNRSTQLKQFILERRVKELPNFALRKSPLVLSVCLSGISQREIITVNSTKPLTTLDLYYITGFSDIIFIILLSIFVLFVAIDSNENLFSVLSYTQYFFLR